MTLARTAALTLAFLGSLPAQETGAEVDKLIQAGRQAYLKGDPAEAKGALDQAHKLAQDLERTDRRRYQVLKLLAGAEAAARRWNEAEEFLQAAMDWRELIAKDPKKPTDDLTELAMLCRAKGDLDRAVAILERVLATILSVPGSLRSMEQVDTLVRLGQVRVERSEPELAEANFSYALRVTEEGVGADHPSLLLLLDRLGEVRIGLRRYESAEAVLRRAMLIRERHVGPAHADLLPGLDGLAYALFGQKKYAEAEPVYRRLLGLWQQSAGADHPMVAGVLDKMAVFYRDQEKLTDARAASDWANGVRSLHLAKGLFQEAVARFKEGDTRESQRLHRRALAALDLTLPATAASGRLPGVSLKGVGAPEPNRTPISAEIDSFRAAVEANLHQLQTPRRKAK